MIPAMLVSAALFALFGSSLIERARVWAESAEIPHLDRRHVAAAALLAAAAFAWSTSAPAPAPGPTPPAPEPAAVMLKGKFVGPSAAADAATSSALFAEIADELEWDGVQADQRYKSGVAFDDLRTRAREMRCRGVALGDTHPRAREAIQSYLDSVAGDSGGPLTSEQRATWVAAYKTLAEAAADASR